MKKFVFANVIPSSRWAARSGIALVLFSTGFVSALFAAPALKTYSTRGTLVQNADGKVVLKDKFGVTWEYSAPAQGSSPAPGKQVKVTYSMNAVKIEAE